jgi:ArsR family transcriptional regulator, arsenate/arsenite/antimonite-responsive transcriptional repressor
MATTSTIHSIALKAIADETRVRLINLFVRSGVSLCVCEIVDALRMPQYQVSKHLTIMKNAGLLTVDKVGTWSYHSLNKNSPMNKMLFSFLKKFLTGEIFDADMRRLDNRLMLREVGRCVVGFVDERELKNLIEEK